MLFFFSFFLCFSLSVWYNCEKLFNEKQLCGLLKGHSSVESMKKYCSFQSFVVCRPKQIMSSMDNCTRRGKVYYSVQMSIGSFLLFNISSWHLMRHETLQTLCLIFHHLISNWYQMTTCTFYLCLSASRSRV